MKPRPNATTKSCGIGASESRQSFPPGFPEVTFSLRRYSCLMKIAGTLYLGGPFVTTLRNHFQNYSLVRVAFNVVIITPHNTMSP